ncbi:MAG: DUF2157 domain-containing protein [Anaerolineales bacterium]|nr:DUF2157 domain-containing protein [Anaerolineales bacterium]
MAKQESLLNKIEEWVEEGLISPEQGDALRQREAGAAAILPARRVKADEIFVYLGSLVVFLAMAFLVGLNWGELESAGRILSMLVPTVAMLALGWRLRGSESAEEAKRLRLRRGAQALWLGACLLSALFFMVTFHELGLIDWSERGPTDPWVLVSCVLATGVAAVAFVLLPTITQSIAFHLCGSAALFTFLGWLDQTLPPFNHFYENLLVLIIGLAAGDLCLALSEWLRSKGRKDLVGVSRIFGTLAILGFTFILAVDEYPATWQKATMEAIAFLVSIASIAASVKWQSQTFLYSGAAFLLFLIIYVNFEHFADRIGMPIALLIIGVLLIGLGLGTGRLSRRIRAPT